MHRSDDEAWFVLEGRLGFRVGDEEREVGAGESILVARGTPHSYWNAIDEPTRSEGRRRPGPPYAGVAAAIVPSATG